MDVRRVMEIKMKLEHEAITVISRIVEICNEEMLVSFNLNSQQLVTMAVDDYGGVIDTTSLHSTLSGMMEGLSDKDIHPETLVLDKVDGNKAVAIINQIIILVKSGKEVCFKGDMGDFTLTIEIGGCHTHVGVSGEYGNLGVLVDQLYNCLIKNSGLSFVCEKESV